MNRLSRTLARPCHRRGFNMVEIALAMAVMALGVISIMALFPIGLNASRDAIAESYAADSADMFLHYYAAQLKSDWTTVKPKFPTSKPNPGNLFEDVAACTGTAVPLSPTAILTLSPSVPPDARAGVFKIEQKAGTGTNAAVDFSGVYRVWRTSLEYYYYKSTTSAWERGELLQDTALALNLEVSWPSQAPYSARQRAFYYLEVFRP